MPLKLPPVLLLAAFVLTVQLSCVGPRTREPSPAAASPPPTEQDKVDQILKRYEEALGGRGAIDDIKSLEMKGTFQIAGMTGAFAGWRKDPNKTLTVVQFPGGTLKKGFDGETRWTQTPAGTYTDNSPEEIAQLERDAEVFNAGKIRSLFESMKLESKGWLKSGDVNVIEGKPANGPAEKLFFDVANGLLVRWDMARRVPNRGIVFVKVHLEDYRDVGGVKMPFNIRFAYEAFNFRIKVDDIKYNTAIDDAVFKKP